MVFDSTSFSIGLKPLFGKGLARGKFNITKVVYLQKRVLNLI